MDIQSTQQLLEGDNNLDPDRPSWIDPTIRYEAVVGSHAYGASREDSDVDIVGCCIPPKEIVFPHLDGEIPGFGRQKQRFENWQCHGLEYEGVDYDVDIFAINSFFQTCMEANPKWLEALFVPNQCALETSEIGDLIRQNRQLFLSGKCFYTFSGYAHSQISKMKKRDRDKERLLKYGYHAVRIISELHQILEEGDLHLDVRSDLLQEVREGKWNLDDIEEYVDDKEEECRYLYENKLMNVPNRPPEEDIREVLLDCLELEYGSLEGCVVR